MTNEDYPHSEDFPKVNDIIINRWSKMNIPLHCLAFAVCPKFYDTDYVRGVKGLLDLSPLGLISRLLRSQVNLSI
jgi:hypothetical protein